jgi:hypothetical protein
VTLLLYGVVRRGHPVPDVEPKVTAVESGELAVLATELPDGRDVVDSDATSYLDALTSAVAQGPVVPIRFGTVAPNADAVVAEVIEPAAKSLRQMLDQTEELVELRLDFVFDEDAAVEAVYREDDEVRAVARRTNESADLTAKIELGQLVAERVRDRRAERVDGWLERLAGTFEQLQVIETSDDTTSVALLVRRDQLDAVDSAASELNADLDADVAMRYVGPLPLFNYLDQLTVDTTGRAEPSGSRWGW